MPELMPSQESPTEVTCDVLVVGAYKEDESFELSAPAKAIDDALDGYVSTHLEDVSFRGKPSETAALTTMGRVPPKTVLVLGLGPRADLTPALLRRALGTVARDYAERAVVAVALEETGNGAAGAVGESFLLASYRYTALKSDPRPARLQQVLLLGADEATVKRAQIRAEATLLARDLINEPAATLTPDALARRAREIADVGGIQVTVLDEKQLAERGMNGVLTVGKGSDVPPRFIRMQYAPEGARGNVALVGKGVTFDSGGLSIKDAKGMETMKTDMSGAAAVIAVMSAVQRLDVRVGVTAYIPCVENMLSGKAVKPGDVITHYGGNRSEVLNTDAEGRLILGDALAWAAEEQPDAIVDVATLTGSIMVALGRDIAGLFCNDEQLADEIKAASDDAGELLWRMPLHSDYRAQIDSEVADFKNTGTRYGGSIVAALFLKEFIPDEIPWAHLDVAGPARSESENHQGPKGGTGVATRTLLSWLEARSK